ncbi:preprotein translocase subunit SecY [Patescibacteria group bacterium]|nr:preprotein translocase subunit SecY [Patescibacteria group bacterium]
MLKIFKLPDLRKKIIFTLLIVAIFRLLAHIPVPGVDTSSIKAYLEQSVFFGFFDLFSGGGFQNFSVVTLGLGPYINASIIIQLLTMLIPSLEELSKEGEFGQEKINMYTKILAVPMSFVQSYGIYFLLSKQGIINTLVGLDLIILILTFTAGSMFLVWLGDLVTEHGVGNGVSLLIFVSIISRLPASALSVVTGIMSSNYVSTIILLVLIVLVVLGVVLVNEGTRNILLEYGRRGERSQKVTNYLPIKINQAGVIPIIFAVSIVSIPGLIGGPFIASARPTLVTIGNFLITYFQSNTLSYNVLYFLLVVAFTFFYTFIQFNPEKIADDVKKRGGFIPGVRPGISTSQYLKKIVLRVTLAGSLFLGLIAILPYFTQFIFGPNAISIGGTSLLISVSVVLETVRQVESLMVTRSYEKFLG